MTLEEKVKAAIRNIPDFPNPGIMFKDITPLLKDPLLCNEIIDNIVDRAKSLGVGAVVGIESRGFMFSLPIALRLNVPFIPIRKIGKLPYTTVRYSYQLEYASATMEMHTDAFAPGTKVLVHDDVLATGGTAAAAAELVKLVQGEVACFCFLIELGFLRGRDRIHQYGAEIIVSAGY